MDVCEDIAQVGIEMQKREARSYRLAVVEFHEREKNQPSQVKEISFLSKSISMADFVVANAKGAVLWTKDGRVLLDFSSGTLNLPLGYGHEAIMDAAIRQIKTGVYFHSSRWHSEPYVEAARLLARLSPNLTVVHHKICSGSDANETALKIARKWTCRRLIATQYESHLGETCEMHGASGRDVGNKEAIIGSRDFVYFPPPKGYTTDEKEAAEALEPYRGQIAAILVEPVPLHAGLRVFSNTHQYLSALRRLADLHGALLIFDEVQTFGWTKALLATNHFMATPDIVSLGKGVGFGFPLSAIIMRDTFRGVLQYNQAELTYGAHVVSCAVAAVGLATLKNKDFQVEEKGAALEWQLRKVMIHHRTVASLRRFGLIVGLTFQGTVEEQNRRADQLYVLALKHNLIIRRAGNGVILKPPLIVTTDQIRLAVELIRNSLTEMGA